MGIQGHVEKANLYYTPKSQKLAIAWAGHNRFEMQDVLRGFSRAMYSNWLWHRPLQLLVDAGEGLQLALGTKVFSPSVVAITHGHSDHARAGHRAAPNVSVLHWSGHRTRRSLPVGDLA